MLDLSPTYHIRLTIIDPNQVREPHEWALSAENQMRHGLTHKGGFNHTSAYFDRANIQANMVGMALDHSRRVGTSSPRSVAPTPATMCVVTIEQVPAMFAAFSPATAAAPQSLPTANVRPHSTARPAELEDVVRRRYWRDMALWDLVSRRKIVCW
mgnify:CR=1 FL=1